MSLIQRIRVRSEIPCTIRPARSPQKTIKGITRELARDSAVMLVCGKPAATWLKLQAEIIIAIALPFRGNSQPRSLEIAAIITRARVQGALLRVTATVRGMTFVDRDDTARNDPTNTHLQEIEQCHF